MKDQSPAKITIYNTQKSMQREDAVLVGGCFDVLHYGHVRFLEEAKKQGGYLIIALESDTSITKWKKRAPIHDMAKRAHNLASLRAVDEIILLPPLQGYDDYLSLVKSIHPKVIAMTDGDPQMDNKRKQGVAVGAKVVVVTTRIEPFSSSKIIQSLQG